MLAQDIHRCAGLLQSVIDSALSISRNVEISQEHRDAQLLDMRNSAVNILSGRLLSKEEGMFHIVKAMNTAFGNPEGEPLDLWATIDDPTYNKVWARLRSQCKNIPKEYEELLTAFDERNVDKVRDALCDIMVFVLGAYHFMGYDANLDMQEVVSAVLTRFCVDEAQLRKTEEHFLQLGVKYYVEGEFPYVRLKSSEDQGDGEYPKGKFLKAVGYREPTFYQVPMLMKVDQYAGVTPQEEAKTQAVGTVRKFFGKQVTQELTQQREVHVANEDAKKAKINDMVAQYRTQLEELMFGLPPFDPNSNNLEGIKPALGA